MRSGRTGLKTFSEQTPQREEDLAVAGVADGDAEGEQADGRVGDQAGKAILAENRPRLRRPDFSGPITEEAVEPLFQAGGQSRQAVPVAWLLDSGRRRKKALSGHRAFPRFKRGALEQANGDDPTWAGPG